MLLLHIVSNEYEYTITFFNLQAFFEFFLFFNIYFNLHDKVFPIEQEREGHAIAIP